MAKLLFSCRKINAHLFANGLESMHPTTWFSLKLGTWEDKLMLVSLSIIKSEKLMTLEVILSKQQAWFLTWTNRKTAIHSHSLTMTTCKFCHPPSICHSYSKHWGHPAPKHYSCLFFQSIWLNSLTFFSYSPPFLFPFSVNYQFPFFLPL